MHLARSGPKNLKCPNGPQNTKNGVLGAAQDASQSMGVTEQKIPTEVTQNFARVQSAAKDTCSRQSLALALLG